MRASILLSGLLAMASAASATENANQLSCMYFQENGQWTYHGFQTSDLSFSLKEHETRILVAAWTSEQPEPPHHAFCSELIGTSSDELVKVRHLKFEGQVIDGISDGCLAEGSDVKNTEDSMIDVKRGSYSKFESSWGAPSFSGKIAVNTYFPTVEEMDHLADIGHQKCLEISP